MIRKEIGMGQSGVLCVTNTEKSVYHLFVECPYAKMVWDEAVQLTGVCAEWRGATLEACFERWYNDEIVADHKALHYCVV
jgi:hypothetical protein